MADRCDALVDELETFERVLKTTDKFDTPEEPGDPPTISEAFEVATVNVRDAKTRLRKCIDSLHLPPDPSPPPPTPVPLVLTLTHFVCVDPSDPFPFIEFDEPYACVFAVDLKVGFAQVPAGAINSKMTLVGPLQLVEVGEREAPPNVIWGLSNAPEFVSAADNLIVLVAMMENDSGSPDQVRTLLEAAAQAAIVQQLPAFIAKQILREELVRRMIADMQGAMGVAKLAGPNPEDDIGPIQELRFIRGELDNIYKGGFVTAVTKNLEFEGDDTKYILKFKLSR